MKRLLAQLYDDWGANDPRNARVISKDENIPGRPTSRPVNFRLVALENMDEAGVNANRGDVLPIATVDTALEALGRDQRGAIGNVTDDDINWIYTDFPPLEEQDEDEDVDMR